MTAPDPEFLERLERIRNRPDIRRILDDPRMADDYNQETGECDGVKYWERES